MAKTTLIIICLNLFSHLLSAQTIDLLLKGGHIIDAKNNINKKMDLAISNGKILKIDANIPESDAKKVLDISGMYVSPGFIDIHTHVFTGPNAGFGHGSSSVKADDFTFRAGVTTVVDAGTSGYKNFPVFKEEVIDRSKTRILAFLNVFGTGMEGTAAEQEDLNVLNIEKAFEINQKYPDIIAGIKIGHYSGSDWKPFDDSAAIAKKI